MIMDIAAYGFMLAPIAVIIIYNLFKHDYARRHFVWFAGAGALWQFASAAAALIMLLLSGRTSYRFGIFWDWFLPGAAYLELDAARLFFMIVIGVVALVSVLIAKRTVDANRSSYTNLLMILMFGMNGMLLVTDLFSLYVFMEVVGISCFVMIAMFRSRADLEGAFKYLIMSELASIFMLLGFALLFMETGSLRYIDMAYLTSPNDGGLKARFVRVALVLIISAFSVKTGVVPFHSWLPDAHQSADTSVSVLLSGIVIKVAGVYGLVTVGRLFGGFDAVGAIYAVLGAVSIVAGALLASRQGHFKRVVAYSSVSQMGYILLGLSTGTTLGLIGALAHVLSHALFKSTLFANAAALHEQAGTLELKDMGGLEERMPKTAFASVVAFLSTAGIPPTAGFWSKLIILIALWQTGQYGLAGLALIASIFTSVYLLRIQKLAFFGHIRESLKGVKEIGGTVLSAEMLLTVLTLAVGVLYPVILIVLRANGLV